MSGAAHPDEFAVTVDEQDGTATARVSGEVDLTTAPEVSEAVQRLAASGARRIVIDLRAVSFMDSSGVGLIMRADATAREAGVELVIAHTPGPGQVARVLELCRVPDRVRTVTDLAELDADA